jgi:hypothetical protein
MDDTPSRGGVTSSSQTPLPVEEAPYQSLEKNKNLAMDSDGTRNQD